MPHTLLDLLECKWRMFKPISTFLNKQKNQYENLQIPHSNISPVIAYSNKLLGGT